MPSQHLSTLSLSHSLFCIWSAQEVNAAFVNWRAHEEACGDAARVEYANKSWPQLGQAMTNTNNLISTWQEVLSFQPDINELVLHGVWRTHAPDYLQFSFSFPTGACLLV